MILQTNQTANRPRDVLDLAATLGEWAAGGHGSLPRRLAHAIRRAIHAGVLPAGSQLPPERRLATSLAVSRTTVTDALDELRSEGLLSSRQGRGTFVAGAPVAAPVVGTRVADHLAAGRGIDLGSNNPADLSHLPSVSVDMAMLTAQGGGAQIFPLGLPALRSAIAELYRRGGVTGRPRVTDVEQIQITTGAHQAVLLLASGLVGGGGTMALAQYGLPGIFDVLDGSGIRVVPIRTDRAGIVPDDLDRALTESRAGAIYLQLGPDTPTGRVTTVARLRSIAAIADRHGVVVIEDATQVPLTFPTARRTDPAGATGLADLCRTATVVTVMSTSKLCWAGLRIGWLRGPESVIERTLRQGLAHDLGPSVPSQLMVLGLLPHLDDVAAERRSRLTVAVDLALAQLSGAIPEAVVERPEGGAVLWVELPVDDAAPFVAAAARNGVRITPGSASAVGRLPNPFVRICVDRPLDLLREGIDRLGRAWHEYRRQPAPGPFGNASS